LPAATPEPQRGGLGNWLRHRLADPVIALLRQGVTARELALSLAFGLGFGVFPVLGVSTVLCTAVAIVLRLNLPAIQLVNYAASPLQLLLIIPFVRIGEKLVGAVPEPLSIDAGLKLLASGVFRAVQLLGSAIVHAAIGWAAIGPFAIYLVYRLLRPLLAKVAANLAPGNE
jgi:uncharacterized protein (DUF2062 family)